MKQVAKKLLVAVSGSDSSINAAKYAIMLAKNFKFELAVVYVVDTHTLKDLLLSKILIEEETSEYEKSMHANADRYLNFVEELAKSKGVNKIEKILKTGNIAASILEASEEADADIIVLGGWEVNRSKRDLVSHAHMEVLMDSKCSILIVKEVEVEEIFKKF
jgi:nucleotide-binding universal stress UspA family protein